MGGALIKHFGERAKPELLRENRAQIQAAVEVPEQVRTYGAVCMRSNVPGILGQYSNIRDCTFRMCTVVCCYYQRLLLIGLA